MPPPPPPGLSATTRLYHKYLALRLPWRRRFLAGADLAGNTFWEFRDALNAGRWRRIVKHTGVTAGMGRMGSGYADLGVSPQWHQWLRHTRVEPPTIEEQQAEVLRQEQMKELAARADERWRSVPSFLDAPNRQQAIPAMAGMGESAAGDGGGVVSERLAVRSPDTGEQENGAGTAPQQEVGREMRGKKPKEASPWQRGKQGAPGEGWTPQEWSPGTAARRGG